MNKKIFNKSGIAIDFGATKISVSQIIKGKFKKTITEPTSIHKIANKDNLFVCWVGVRAAVFGRAGVPMEVR